MGPDPYVEYSRAKKREKGWFNTLSYSFRLVPAVCNYWVDFDIHDGESGKVYYHNQGQWIGGCESTVLETRGTRALDADYELRPDSDVCITVFRRSGEEVMQVVKSCGVIS